MLDVVAGENGIHRSIRHCGHIRHGADNIGSNALVDVEAQLLPVGAIEAARGLVLALGAAADVEKSFHAKSFGLLFSLGGLPRRRGNTAWPRRFSIISAKRLSPTTTPCWVAVRIKFQAGSSTSVANKSR